MANPKTRSREDNITEMTRLQNMYKRLPPDKQKAAHKHMQNRLDELQAAINGKKAPSKGMGLMQTVLIVLVASVVAVALGFFGVTFLAKG